MCVRGAIQYMYRYTWLWILPFFFFLPVSNQVYKQLCGKNRFSLAKVHCFLMYHTLYIQLKFSVTKLSTLKKSFLYIFQYQKSFVSSTLVLYRSGCRPATKLARYVGNLWVRINAKSEKCNFLVSFYRPTFLFFVPFLLLISLY